LAVFWRKVGGFYQYLDVIMVVSKDKETRVRHALPILAPFRLSLEATYKKIKNKDVESPVLSVSFSLGSKYCNKLGMKLTRRRTLKAIVKIALCSLQ